MINELIDAITSVLTDEKAYNLPNVCVSYGLENGEESEASMSKRIYVQQRLKGKDRLFLLDLAKRIIKDYGSKATNLSKTLYRMEQTGLYSISEVTRRFILEGLYGMGNIEGGMELIDFLNRIWDLEKMPSTDSRFSSASEDIYQHMINNNDWEEDFLYEKYLGLQTAPDEIFIHFLEQVVHPIVRQQSQMEYIEFLNQYLVKDSFQFYHSDNLSGFPVYKINNLQGGVKGKVKNLIFAAVGFKPEIVISDSINNDIKIVKNEENCLTYDRPIPDTGFYWKDLLKWWADKEGMDESEKETEDALYKRLFNSLDSKPEKVLFFKYFSFFKKRFNSNFPALIPQVYLHYDPYTMKQRLNKAVLPRQRMDFLLLFSNKQRIVLEIDGKQHYSDGDISSPRKYSEMVHADRELKLNGYDVYRFGGFELMNTNTNEQLIKDFFEKLFIKHGIKPDC
ncbi:hypothetical protein [Peribacillus simplex]|uniref:AbiJ-related protein n=1 Tax=Peribacillus simplex TaxID=1478 RepID=UPI0028535C13|nr:hypothetical protein [Peribacillus simplex]MDR4927233.1 hypothetical protein [Peribacillus simplex]